MHCVDWSTFSDNNHGNGPDRRKIPNLTKSQRCGVAHFKLNPVWHKKRNSHRKSLNAVFLIISAPLLYSE